MSIIIPARNEERYIYDTLYMLANQDYPKEKYELIVVDGRSEDGTRQIVEKFINEHSDLNIRLLDNPRILSSCARNIGIREAKGQLIGIIDAHVYVASKELFKSMERLKKESGALCLSRPAPLNVPNLEEGKAYWIAISRKSWLGHSLNSYIYSNYEGFIDPTSSGFAYDRTIFEKFGYFDESFDAAEDVEFNFRLKRAGIMAYTSPSLLIYSYPRNSFYSLLKQQIRYGVGRARFVRKHIGGLNKETPIPALIFLLFICSPLIVIFSFWLPWIFLVYSILISIYSSILLITGFKEALARGKFLPGIMIAIAIWITHIGLGW